MNLYITVFLLFICVLIYLTFWHEVNIDGASASESFDHRGIVAEGFDEPIHFLSSDETRDLISSNADGYFERFTQNDLRARTKQRDHKVMVVPQLDHKVMVVPQLDHKVMVVPQLDQYIQGFNCGDFTDSEKDLIADCIAEIETIVVKDIAIDWVDSDKFHAIPWKIGLIADDSYEYGLPHTRIDTILIPKTSVVTAKTDKKDLLHTLIHEKLHVYQKLYPADFQKYLDHHGFVKYARYGSLGELASNPDTDEYVYAKKSGLKRVVHCGKYDFSTGKTGVKSIVYQPINDAKYDHPRELAVYNLLENLL